MALIVHHVLARFIASILLSVLVEVRLAPRLSGERVNVVDLLVTLIVLFISLTVLSEAY
jgi:hypothetical protein